MESTLKVIPLAISILVKKKKKVENFKFSCGDDNVDLSLKEQMDELCKSN